MPNMELVEALGKRGTQILRSVVCVENGARLERAIAGSHP
jgi:hypothetical protein